MDGDFHFTKFQNFAVYCMVHVDRILRRVTNMLLKGERE